MKKSYLDFDIQQDVKFRENEQVILTLQNPRFCLLMRWNIFELYKHVRYAVYNCKPLYLPLNQYDNISYSQVYIYDDMACNILHSLNELIKIYKKEV